MKNKRFALVVPNNRLIKCWPNYAKNFEIFEIDKSNVKLFVVDDFSPYVKDNIKILRHSNVPFEYLTIERQVEFFKAEFGSNYEKYWEVIPHKTDACRSFGYLIAALWGADVIITFDDDNYPICEKNEIYNYIGMHDVVNCTIDCTELLSSTNWFNTIDMLMLKPKNRRLFARGFPYGKRYGKSRYILKKSEGKVVMNVGLWTGNPDVDSLTLLNEGSLNGLARTKSITLKNYKRIMLSVGTYAPLNTANTAYSRELLPICYDTFQGANVGELKLDRFGDIWCNLFIKKIIDRLNRRVTIGVPLVEHRREPRDTFIDFQKEFWGIILSEKLFHFVESTDLYSKTYADLYFELIDNMRKEFVKKIQQIPIQKYFDKLFLSMERWIEIVEKLGLV